MLIEDAADAGDDERRGHRTGINPERHPQRRRQDAGLVTDVAHAAAQVLRVVVEPKCDTAAELQHFPDPESDQER